MVYGRHVAAAGVAVSRRRALTGTSVARSHFCGTQGGRAAEHPACGACWTSCGPRSGQATVAIPAAGARPARTVDRVRKVAHHPALSLCRPPRDRACLI